MSIEDKKATSPSGFHLQHRLEPENKIFDFKWSPDGRMLASTSSQAVTNIWEIESGRLLRSLFSRSLTSHNTDDTTSLAWSPDSTKLALAFYGEIIQLWDVSSGNFLQKLELGTVRTNTILSISWSPDGQMLALACSDAIVRILSLLTGKLRWELEGHYRAVTDVIWLSNGQLLASASSDKTVKLWDTKSGSMLLNIEGNLNENLSVACSPTEQFLALSTGYRNSSGDYSIMLFDLETEKQIRVLNGHRYPAVNSSFSSDGRFLVSRAKDGTTRLWRCDTWELVSISKESIPDELKTSILFHPQGHTLATLLAIPVNERAVMGREESAIHIWNLESDILLNEINEDAINDTLSTFDLPIATATTITDSLRYTNAKVVLVGDAGVGKTALGLVLTNHPFIPPEATHGRYVWSFDTNTLPVNSEFNEIRETLLWDLAGQPGYRVFHRQHLNDVAVALVLFDSRSETDPFAGVAYWARALDEATHGFPLVKFLVASKIDRGGPQVSDARIQGFCGSYGFQELFETSAKRGDAVKELSQAIRKAIRWDKMSSISTPKFFNAIKTFVVNEKKEGRVLQNRGELIDRYRASNLDDTTEVEVFDICFKQIEAAGFIKQLTFGKLLLLQPEMIDSYCAWLALAARSEPDGLGSIPERQARIGDFPMDEDRSLKGKAEEQLLFTATVEDIVGRGIALRQPTEDGEMLVFPSELRTDIPDFPGHYVRVMTFLFEGSVKAIYATLAVCLAHTTAFRKKQFFRDAAIFNSASDENCGFAVNYPHLYNDSLGRLIVFFDENTSRTTKLTFLRYVNRQLEEMAFEGSVKRERVYQCICNYLIPEDAIARRISRGESTAICPDCGRHMPIDDLAEQSAQYDETVESQIERSSEEMARQRRLAVIGERERRAEFHVFLCHNTQDKSEVRLLANKLREQGVLPWIDEQGILAGQFVPELESAIDAAPAVLIIVGTNWLGRWQLQEYFAFLQRFVEHRKDQEKKRLVLIPVLLPGAPQAPELPVFMRGFNWIDFRQKNGLENHHQMQRLVKFILEL